MQTYNLRTFYILALTQFFSLIGSRMTGIALGIWIFEETGNTAPLMIALFFAEIPGILVGSFTGFLADRFDRRHVMIAGDIGQAVGTLVLMISFLSGAFAFWHLYLVVLVQGIFREVQEPASAASIAMLVPEDHRDRANGLQSMSHPLAGVIAPVITGLLYSVSDIVGVMAVDLITFVVAMGVVMLLHIPRPEPEDDETDQPFWHEVMGGWRYLLEHRPLLWMTLYLSFIYFMMNGPLALDVPYILAITGDESLLGLLLGASSLGAFAGGFALTLAGKIENRIPLIMAGYLFHAVMMIVYGVVRDPILLGVALFWVMFPLPPTGAMFATVLQNRVPPARQGRVFAVTGQLFVAFTPISFLLTGWLVDKVLEPAVGGSGWGWVAPLVGDGAGAGMGLVLVVTGLIISAATMITYAIPGIRHLEGQTQPEKRSRAFAKSG